MDIGIGIPNSIPGTSGGLLLDWARRAEEAGFSSLATIGAVAFPTHEELTVLAAAAAVTERIGLLTNVLIAPARSTAELAKQSATVDQVSNGRLTMGLGVGWRDIDYVLTGRDFSNRGEAFDAMLRDLHTAWRGEALTEDTRPVAQRPVQETGVPLLIGGYTDVAMRRMAEHGIGFTAGGLPPDQVAAKVERARAVWKEHGREGHPKIVALAYYGLGDTEEESRAYLFDYYEPMGDEMAETIAGSALRSEDALRGALSAYAEAGIDELILDPTVADLGQVDGLAEIVL